MLRRSSGKQWLTAKAVIGLFPPMRRGECEVYADDARRELIARLHFLRASKRANPRGRSICCSRTYIAPKSSGKRDYIGAFAVTRHRYSPENRMSLRRLPSMTL